MKRKIGRVTFAFAIVLILMLISPMFTSVVYAKDLDKIHTYQITADVQSDGKVKMTYGGQGIIRFKDKMLGKRVYVIFPMYRKNTEDGVIIAVDEILNKGIHPENDHSCGIPLGRKYVGRKCITILQEG